MPDPKQKKRPDGVTDDKRPVSQLRKALHLDNNLPIFEKISENIKKIGEEFLRVADPPTIQTKALETIRKELIRRHPEIFDDQDAERRLYLAKRVIVQRHSWARHIHKRKMEKKNFKTSPNKTHRKKTPDRQCKERRPSGLKTAPNVEKSEKSSIVNNSPYRYCDIVVPTRFRSDPAQSGTPERAPVSRGPDLPITPRCAPSPNNCSQTLATSSSTASTFPKTPSQTSTSRSNNSKNATMRDSNSGIMTPDTPSRRQTFNSPVSLHYGFAYEAVYRFLDTCTPSMAHFWGDFIAYGCDDEEILLAVSYWSPDYVNSFLHRFANKSQEPMSEMDIEVLQTHFLTYFKG